MARRPVGGPPGSTRTLKKILLSLVAIGAAASLSVSGTYAILSSADTNASSTVASGTLTFGNTVNTGTTCYSYGSPSSSANQNPTCSPLFSSSTLVYPGSSGSAAVTIANNGSIGIGDLSVYMPSCAAQASPGAGTLAGGGDPCSYINAGGVWDGPLLSIQETDSSGTATFCWWPDDAAGTCNPSAFDWFAYMAQGINTSSGATSLGAGPAAGQSRYFKITVSLPANADPTLQGEEALFSLAWHVTT